MQIKACLCPTPTHAKRVQYPSKTVGDMSTAAISQASPRVQIRAATYLKGCIGRSTERDRVPMQEAHGAVFKTLHFFHAVLKRCMVLAPKLRMADARCGASNAPAFSVFADAFTDVPLPRTEPQLTRTNPS